METRANPLIVGLFALAVLAGAFGFIYWMGSYGAAGSKVSYHVQFQGEVTGLTEGSSVLYNGIRIGEVSGLRLDPEDPSKVISTIRIEKGYPVSAQTSAQLQFQTLTGVAQIQLQPGTDQQGEPLEPGALIVAQRSNFQDLLENGQALMTKFDSIAGKVDQLLSQNQQAVSTTLRNVESFTKALADNSGTVQTFLTDASSAARRLNELGEKVGVLSDSLEGLVSSIDTGDVSAIVSDARTFTDQLAQSSGRIDEIAQNVTEASQRLNALAGNLEGAGSRASEVMAAVDPARLSSLLANIDTFSGQLASAGGQLDGVLTDVRGAAQRIDEVGGSVNTLVAAVDAERVNETLANAATFSEALARNAGQLDGLVEDARSAVREFASAGGQVRTLGETINTLVTNSSPSISNSLANIETFSGQLSSAGGRIDGVLGDVGSAARRIDEVGGTVNTLVAAISAEDVNQTLANARSFSEALARNGEQIDGLVTDARSTVQGLNTLSGNLNGVVTSIDREKLSNTLANVETFSGQLSAAGQQIDGVLTDVRGAAQQLGQVGGSVNTLVAAISTEDVNQTLANARNFSEALARNGEQIDGLVTEARSTVQGLNTLSGNLNGVVTSIDREKLSNTLANVETFSGQLSAAGQQIDGVITDVRGAAQQLGQVGGSVNTLVAAVDPARLGNTVANAESFTAALARNGEQLDGLLQDARTAANNIGAAGDSVGSLSNDIKGVVAAVDPQEVQSVVSNVRQFSDMLAANADKVSRLADAAISAAERIDRVGARLETIGADVDAVVAAVEPAKVAETLGNIQTFTGSLARNSAAVDSFVSNAQEAARSLTEAGNKVSELGETARQTISGVDSEQIRSVMTNVQDFTGMLSQNRELVTSFLSSASDAAGKVGTLAGRASDIATAIDPTALQRSITNVESFTVGLASKTEQVEGFIDDASAVAAQLRTTSQKLDKLLAQANGMIEGGGEGFFTEATQAAAAIKDTANNLNSRLDSITGDIQRYGTGGLKEFQQLMTDGRQTLSEVERVIRRLEQNPAGFLSGSSSEVQEYNPGRRF